MTIFGNLLGGALGGSLGLLAGSPPGAVVLGGLGAGLLGQYFKKGGRVKLNRRRPGRTCRK